MIMYAVRGSVVARVEVPTPRQCVYIDPKHLLPNEIMQNADFIFVVNKDETVEFLKKRSYGKNTNFFNLTLALRHIERYYNDEFKMESFEIWNLTNCNSISEKRDEVMSYVKKLREGV